MPKQSKRFRKLGEKKKADPVPIAEAVTVLKNYGGTKFDQSVEIAIRLGQLVGTVKTRMRTGMIALRTLLQPLLTQELP